MVGEKQHKSSVECEKRRDFLESKSKAKHQLLSEMVNERRETVKVAGVSVTKQTDEEVQYPGSSRAKREAGADQLSTAEEAERSRELFHSYNPGGKRGDVDSFGVYHKKKSQPKGIRDDH